MKLKREKLARIKILTDLKAEVSKGRYATKKAAVQAIQGEIERLNEARKPAPDDSLMASSTTAKFQRWASMKQADLQNDLALAMARAQPFKETAAKDEARTQVVARLQKRSKS